MARFVRDEKRTFPFAWLIIGGIFAGAAAWAMYAEMVTRVPWQKHQQAYFEMELEQAEQALRAEEEAWAVASGQEPLAGLLARQAELEAQKEKGDYAEAAAKLAELDTAYFDQEQEKTFGASDLDEAYYYRNLAEYERDAAQVQVRKLYVKNYAGQPRALEEPAKIYLDPPPPDRDEADSDAVYHLKSEIARMQAHADAVEAALARGHADPELIRAMRASAESERKVVGILEQEIRHQQRIDRALAAMAAVDGPADPPVEETDPAKRDAAVTAARATVCEGQAETRNCITWLRLEPVDKELKAITITVSKAKRPLIDAQLRFEKAKDRAHPEFDMANPLQALVGPYQIEQVVLSWMDAERDVDLQQVDRCHTCHMGVNKGIYTDAAIEPLFRTHPNRDVLMASHPIEKFGCTACHQGQGRATDDLAHSGWHLEVKHGKERWHFDGDHYWEDPMLQVGHLSKIIVDDANDTMLVKIGRGKPAEIKLEHRTPTETYDQDSSPESRLLGEIQEGLQAIVDADDKLEGKWRANCSKLDNRVHLGLEPLDTEAAADPPSIEITFPKLELAKVLGFGRTRELTSKTETMFVATKPMHQPVRADNARAAGSIVDTAEDYDYIPPNGDYGLQVSDDMRNRFIAAMPQVEAGCLRCHANDVDLAPHRSQFEHVKSKLAYQEAQAALIANPEAYQEKHGTLDLPPVAAAPSEVHSLAPTLDEGRQLFRQLNCTGCHLLEGYENNADHGPQLNDISAKVSPKWLLTWLRHPRGWRGKTSMPNFWPRPLDPASKVPYPEGTPEFEEWMQLRTEETVAIAAYLWDRSENPEKRPSQGAESKPLAEKIAGYADVPGANADEGKVLFEAYGCQGCHANVDNGKELPEAWRGRERDLAPTLSNLAEKTNADWVAYWVENPSRYWHKTSMPNLRLTRKEAASVAKYLASLHHSGPAPAHVADDELALVTDPKRREETVSCAAAGGREMSRVDCGAKVIEVRGCYGCHAIEGFESFAPIGPELTGFAKKDITTLDYGYAIADHHLQTTETFAALKIDAPRIYARDRIELKMADFDASAEEIRALVVFLKGTIPDKPAEDYDPLKSQDFAAAMRGRQLVNDLNCRGCHVLEGRGADIDGWRAALLQQDPQRRAPWLDGEGGRVQPEWLFTFLRNPGENGIRPWLHPHWAYGDDVPDDKKALRMPTFNLSSEQWTDIVRYFATWDDQEYPYQVPEVKELTRDEKLWSAVNINSTQTGNCLSCHYFDEFPVERARGDLKKMAPDMNIMRSRLRPEWVEQWLLRPHNYLPYTSMTAFFATKDREKTETFFPKENDPYISPVPNGWDKAVPGLRPLTTPEHASVLRDFLFGIPEGAAWPKPGDEAKSPVVDPTAAASVAEVAEDDDAEAGDLPADEQPGG